MTDWIAAASALSPLLALFVGGLVVMIADVSFEDRTELSILSALIFFVAGALALKLWSVPVDGLPEGITTYIAVDRVALFMDVVVCAGAGLSALLAGGYLREHGFERGEFYVLLLFGAFGCMFLARANDLISLFIGLETMSLAAYSLIGYRRTSQRAVEGATKYFLLGSFAAAILLFGSALIYGATGSTNFEAIAQAVRSGAADPRLVLFAILFVLVGLAFKVSAVPFHMWTPDAYEGAATPVTTFMSVAIKAAAFAVLTRILLVSFGDEGSADMRTGWPVAVAILAAVTMVHGNLAALAQSSVKRMLAYSSIAHAGYALIGVCAAVRDETAGLSSVLYYLLAYTVSNALAFGSLIWLGSRGREAVSYEDLHGAGRRHPLIALPFVVGILSLMGFPPTAGFFAKYYVFQAAVHAGGGLVWLAVLGAVASIVGAYYYLRVLVALFMKEPAPDAVLAVPMRSGHVASALSIASVYVLLMGILPARYLELAMEAAQSWAG